MRETAHLINSPVGQVFLFDDVISVWDKSLCCARRGCSRPATWLMAYHKPCGHDPACDRCRREWLQSAQMALAEDGGVVVCSDCGRKLTTVEQIARVLPL